MSNEVEISVVIRAKNEDRWIGHCIQSVLDNIESPEIIVVDNMSTDETIPIVKTFQHDPSLSDSKGYTSTKVIQIEDYSPGLALNKGISYASGKYILVISSHCVLQRFPKELITKHLKEHIAVFGNQNPFYNGKRISKRYLWSHFIEEEVVNMFSDIEDRYFFHNALSFFKKSDIIKFPFNENLTGKEDRYWAIDMVKEGKSYIYVPSFLADHHYTENGNTWKGIG
tara:strand:+ start:5829 stop:6506 length:678 start_codon:yes stop_codon:yes gene_type:complete